MWVFGYGSLVWNPEFQVAEQVVATLPGYRRSFCMSSIHHRGTSERPGLVLALDAEHGAQCTGLALRAAPGTEAETLAALRERELVSAAYLERQVRLETSDGRVLEAVAYVVDKDHPQYRGALDLETQADIIARAHGGRGANAEYLSRTVAGLEANGIPDPDLAQLASRVSQIAAKPSGALGPEGPIS